MKLQSMSMPALPLMMMPLYFGSFSRLTTQNRSDPGTLAAVASAWISGASVMKRELNGRTFLTASSTFTWSTIWPLSAGKVTLG